MVTASTKTIKDTLDTKTNKEIKELLYQLLKYKKENKELATYLLFYEQEETEFVADAKAVITEQFEEVNTKTVFYAKKGLRKMIRLASKFSKYSSDKTTTIELGLHIAGHLSTLPKQLKSSLLIRNMYIANLKKINATLELLHADIQFDYKKQIQNLAISL